MPDRAWERGLHQLIEIKEGCEPTGRRETLARRLDMGAIRCVVLVDGETITDLEFGAFDGRDSDFGDLIGYPTRISENGARHIVLTNQDLYLGAGVDVDDNGFNTTPNGMGDDLNGIDDEDGVRFLATAVRPGIDVQFEITAVGAGGVLNAWVDFNNDGDWDDPGEQIFTDVEDLGTGAPITLTVRTPADVDVSATAYAARFRYGPIGLSYTGPANAGEVEDYLLVHDSPILTSLLVGDFDGDSLVTTDDHALWASTYGSTTDLRADANGDRVVDAAGYSLWRDAYDLAQASAAALALSAPQVVTMPIEEAAPEPVTLDVTSVSPLLLVEPVVAAAVDASFDEEAPAPSGGDAVDAALLLWALERDPESDVADDVESAESHEDSEIEDEEPLDLASALAL